MPNPIYAGPEWQAIRRQILNRDGGVCQIRLPKCKRRATHVDHIVDVEDGGARLDPANLRAACASCNISKRNTAVAARARAYRNGGTVAPPVPVDTTPRWWRWFVGIGWDRISERFAEPDIDRLQVGKPTGPPSGGTP